MRKIIRLELIYIVFWIIEIILLYPLITEYHNYNEFILVDKMINELKDEDMVEPLYFNIEETIKRLPNKLIRKLYNIGVTIDTTDNIGQCSKYGKVTSKYTHRNKTITIHKIYSNESVLLHEIGHAISYNELPFIKLSDTYIFKKIYENEKDLIFPDGEKFYYSNFNVKYEYIKINSEEYFAQCFSMYILEILPKETDTYDFFEKYFDRKFL